MGLLRHYSMLESVHLKLLHDKSIGLRHSEYVNSNSMNERQKNATNHVAKSFDNIIENSEISVFHQCQEWQIEWRAFSGRTKHEKNEENYLFRCFFLRVCVHFSFHFILSLFRTESGIVGLVAWEKRHAQLGPYLNVGNVLNHQHGSASAAAAAAIYSNVIWKHAIGSGKFEWIAARYKSVGFSDDESSRWYTKSECKWMDWLWAWNLIVLIVIVLLLIGTQHTEFQNAIESFGSTETTKLFWRWIAGQRCRDCCAEGNCGGVYDLFQHVLLWTSTP